MVRLAVQTLRDFEIDNFLSVYVFVCVFVSTILSYSTHESGRSTRCEFFINHLCYQSQFIFELGKLLSLFIK